jgi:hypothetical protein
MEEMDVAAEMVAKMNVVAEMAAEDAVAAVMEAEEVTTTVEMAADRVDGSEDGGGEGVVTRMNL